MGNFYLDDETRKNEKTIKDSFPDFNRANLYRQAVVDFINNNLTDVDSLKKKIEEEKQIQEASKKKQKHFQSLIENFAEREKQKVSLKRKAEKKMPKKEEKKFIAQTINNINEIFPEINQNFSSDKVLSLARDFVAQFQQPDKLTLADFLKSRGYKFVEEEIQA